MISARPNLIIISKKKKKKRKRKSAHRIKLKKYEKMDIYIALAREIKKNLWNITLKIIPIVIGAFGTVTKGFLKGLEDFEVGGQTTTLLRTARILRRAPKTWVQLDLYKCSPPPKKKTRK